MPEGPEIRRTADRIRRSVGELVTDEVRFGLPRLIEYEETLSGKRVLGAEARGKALLTHFEGGFSVYCHSNLYGRWRFARRGKAPELRRQLRFAIRTERSEALLYSASDIDVLYADELDQHPFLAKLGPDPLNAETTASDIEAQLERFARRSLGASLLDQAFVAGMGNYLRSEVLFFAGVAPERRPRELATEERQRLVESAIEIPRRAYRHGSVTVEPEAAKALRAGGAARRVYRHAVFGKAGLPCPTCGRRIEKVQIANRRLYVCRTCQR